VPGVDFSNDPLLQGRNFSYGDTQVKRLGGPNFTYLPVNAPKCPMHTIQQDGHMASANPKTRVNYEPNSWGAELGGPRESPDVGFESYPAPEEGSKVRVRSETLADHYSQARQFYISQARVEQEPSAASFTFELSKVENPAIRSRLVSHLLNVDKMLGETVAKSLRLKTIPNLLRPPEQPVPI
jgi:catalase